MKSLSEFLNMGGYAAYVWTSYGTCMLILLWNVLHARKEARLTLQKIKQRLQHQERAQ